MRRWRPRLDSRSRWATLLAAVTLGCASTPPRAVPPPVGAVPASEAPGVPLALTLDDLPYAGPTVGGTAPAQALERIVTVLEARSVPVTGFVTCGRLGDDAADLAPWVAADLPIGNHSTAHRSVDELGQAAFVADARACRDRLASLTGEPPRYFRYPRLQTGAERRLRDAVAADVAALGHRRAPVSIDTADWVLAEAYAKAVSTGDRDRATALAGAYVAHVQRAARRYRQLARARVGREIAQVLLLHANALASDHLGAVLTMLEREGFRFVSLEEALADEVYGRSDDWVDPVGASWLLRLAPAAPEQWGWDRGQQRGMALRFGLEEDASAQERIGPHLQAARIAAKTWRIVHTEAVAANALVQQTSEGETVLADTPWTPEATRNLLDWLEARFGAPPALATASHFHLDAAGGLGALLEAGVPVVVSDRTAALLESRGESMRTSLKDTFGGSFDGWQVVAPTTTFPLAEGYRTTVGGSEVQIVHPGAGHAPDNVVTWFPEAGVMFGGCMVKGGDDLGFLGDANRETWPGAMRALQALEPELVVPGHGTRTDPGQLAHTERLLLDGAPGVR